jgi:hypothetical protein
MSSIESLHRMTRDDRDLEGLVVSGSDHLTAYNVYAEAFASAGYMGEEYGLPRHLFDERIDEWAEQRGVLVKAIEDTALAMASVFRGVGLPLPSQLSYAQEQTRRTFADLVARYMPFDLVIDEQTADGQPARVSRTSVAGSWGPVAGNLRFFADRFGVARAAIEGTTLSYDLIREYAQWGPPRLSVGGPRKHQRITVSRTLTYFGFELEADSEALEGRIPPALLPAALAALTDALLEGETVHPDQGRLRRSLDRLDELWRRSAGTLDVVSPDALRGRVRAALEAEGVNSWETFVRSRVSIDPASLVDPAIAEQLESLPNSARVKGDVVPLDYEIRQGEGVVRLTLREGQARRLRTGELPVFDRPIVFAARRGSHAPLLAGTLPELQALLKREPAPESRNARDDEGRRGKRRGGGYRQPHQRGGGGGRKGKGGRGR